MGWEWSKVDPFALTQFVTPTARHELALNINIDDILQQCGRKAVVRAIYDALLDRQIQYAREKYEPSKAIQHIRTPSEILNQTSEGTCLDLALLFCGVCLSCELLPLLIVFEGHAIVAVSLNYSLREWDAYKRREYEELFKNIMLNERGPMHELVSGGAYLPIECTGFARSKTISGSVPEALNRDNDGTLSFDNATKAGLAHFDLVASRPFKFALDIAVAHFFWKLKPATTPAAALAVTYWPVDKQSPPPPKLLPSLLDRNNQESELKKAVLIHRVEKPNGPIICVVHGYEDECHVEFLHRLKERTLPAVIEYWYPGKTKEYPLGVFKMAVSLRRLTGNNYEQELWQDLGLATNKDKFTPKEQVIEAVIGGKCATVIDVHLFTGDLNLTNLKVIDLFIKFWDGDVWRNLPGDFLLIICLCFRYRKDYQPPRRSLRQIFSPRVSNDKIRKHITSQHFRDFKNYPHLSGVVLGELESIRQTDAEDLIENEQVKQWFDFEQSEINGLYRRKELCTKEGHIPMETLLNSLIGIYRQKRAMLVGGYR
jgi:hypothetical protein